MADNELPMEKVEKINLDLFLETERQQETIRKLQSKLSKLEKIPIESADSEELEKVKYKNSQLRDENKDLQTELQNIKNHNQDLQQQLDLLKKELATPQPASEEPASKLVDELEESKEIIARQNKIIEDLEDEMIDLDQKYDKINLGLKKKIKSLQRDITKLEEENQKLSRAKFANLRPQQFVKDDSMSDSDSELLDKMKQILKSWPGGIKLRNLAMSMGISVANTNEFLSILKQEGLVRVDTENVENSNPVIYPQ